MTGLEVPIACVVAWVWRKARRVGSAADTEVDRALDAGMARVHDMVTAKLAGDPALVRLHAEADAAARAAEQEPAATASDAPSAEPGAAAADSTAGPAATEPGERTVRRLTDALAQAVEDDADFAAELTRAAEDYERLKAAAGPQAAGNSVRADHSGVTAGGDITNNGGVIGRDFSAPVTVGAQDPSQPRPTQR